MHGQGELPQAPDLDHDLHGHRDDEEVVRHLEDAVVNHLVGVGLAQLDDGGDGGHDDHTPVQVRYQPQQLVDSFQFDISLFACLRVPCIIPSIRH